MGSGLRAIAGLQRSEELNVTWIGHSTVLVEAEGVRVLTDPLLRPRIAHLRRVGPAAVAAVASVDAILISHVHHDHLDFRSLQVVHANCLVVPRGVGRLLQARGLGPVVELDPGGSTSVGGLTVLATHAEHRARRHPFAAVSPALGYLLAGRARLYFAGDTDIFDGMRDLEPDLDVAMLPISGWGSRIPSGHLDPERAAEALRLLRPRIAIPIHWGTYRRVGLSRDAALLRERAEAFARRAAEVAPDVKIIILAPGESVEIPLPTPASGARS